MRVLLFIIFFNQCFYLLSMNNFPEEVKESNLRVKSLKEVCLLHVLNALLNNSCPEKISLNSINNIPNELIEEIADLSCSLNDCNIEAIKNESFAVVVSQDHNFLAQAHCSLVEGRAINLTNSVILSDLEKNKEVFKYTSKSQVSTKWVALSPNAKYIAYPKQSIDKKIAYPIKKVIIHDLKNEKDVFDFTITSLDTFLYIKFLSNNQIVYVNDQQVFLYTIGNDKTVNFTINNPLKSCFFLDNKFFIYAAQDNKSCFSYDVLSKKYIESFSFGSDISSSLAFSGNNLIAAGTERDGVHVWRVNDLGKKINDKTFYSNNKVCSVAFDRISKYLLVAEEKKGAALTIWNINLNCMLHKIEISIHSVPKVVSWSNTGNSIILAYDFFENDSTGSNKKKLYSQYKFIGLFLGLDIKKKLLKE